MTWSTSDVAACCSSASTSLFIQFGPRATPNPPYWLRRETMSTTGQSRRLDEIRDVSALHSTAA
jgi:hypothetical protein